MMNKKINSIIAFMVLTVSQTFAQNILPFSSVRYWVGSGTDSAALVVSFDNSDFDSSTVWGLLFNDSISGMEAFNLVSNQDVNFEAQLNGIFLDSVGYHRHNGKNGDKGFYWGTYSFGDTVWDFNSGLITTIKHGDWFGVSYTDFNPAVLPGTPIPALNPNSLDKSVFDSIGWFGTGSDVAYLIVDFVPETTGRSYTFGIKFDDSITGQEMLQLITSEDTNFKIDAGAFLNDIVYLQDTGLGGAPNYWGTWSGTNPGNWYMNSGLATVVKNGELFGCAYTDFYPALRPDVSTLVGSVPDNTNVKSTIFSPVNVAVYPNPFSENLTVSLSGDSLKQLIVRDMQGRIVFTTVEIDSSDNHQLNTGNWNSGLYLLECRGENSNQTIKIIKP